MIKNYLTIALRYIIRHKVFTFINISGLTLGITCSLLIFLFIQDELRYDRFHPDAGRIHRLALTGILQGERLNSSGTGYFVAPALASANPRIASYLRLATWSTFPIRYEDKSFTEDYLLISDPNFFRFFNFRLVIGHPDSVLNGPRKIVITESAAKRYFGYTGRQDHSPIGKTLTLAQGYLARVSGIAEDPPLQSHFHFTHILSLSSWDEQGQSWLDGSVHSYLKCKPGTDLVALMEELTPIFNSHVNDELKTMSEMDINEFRREGNQVSLILQPLTDLHLHSHLDDEIEPNGDIRNIYIFATIAIFITALACINFMNLFTARSSSRYKEIGVRKAAGAQSIRLVGQFMLESYLYVVIAVLVSLFLVLVLLGPFNFFTGKDLGLGSMNNPGFITGTIIFVLLTGLAAGSYPSFYLAQFSPSEALKGTLRASLRSYGIRNILVVFQFFISTGLIIATVVVYHQLNYIRHADLGFDKSNIVNLLHTKNLEENAAAFREELLQDPGIVAASYASRLPPNVDWQTLIRPEGTNKDYLVNVYEVDYDHLETMGYTLAKGRFFSRELPQDSVAVILNETAASTLNIEGTESVITYTQDNKPRMRHIIGIVRDFNFQSLKDPIRPVAFMLGSVPGWEMAIRITPGNVDAKIETIRSLFSKHAGGAPFEYSLVDENFRNESSSERKLSILFTLLTLVAIFIACFGLLGLATFTVQQRTKEIGIRKVLGATVSHIMTLLNKDFLKLVLIANLLAWPAAWWFMNQWLNEFAYRVTIEWWIFLVAGMVTLLIAVLAVSLQAVRSATGNPVDSLRND